MPQTKRVLLPRHKTRQLFQMAAGWGAVGALFTVLGVLVETVGRRFGPPITEFMMGGTWLAFAGLYLLAAVQHRNLDRSRAQRRESNGPQSFTDRSIQGF